MKKQISKKVQPITNFTKVHPLSKKQLSKVQGGNDGDKTDDYIGVIDVVDI